MLRIVPKGFSVLPARLKKVAETRRRASPERSSAPMVLAKAAGSGLPAIASISATCWASARSKAGS